MVRNTAIQHIIQSSKNDIEIVLLSCNPRYLGLSERWPKIFSIQDGWILLRESQEHVTDDILHASLRSLNRECEYEVSLAMQYRDRNIQAYGEWHPLHGVVLTLLFSYSVARWAVRNTVEVFVSDLYILKNSLDAQRVVLSPETASADMEELDWSEFVEL